MYSLNKWSTIFIISTIQILIVGLLFGFHYGWIDDLYLDLLFRKEVLCLGDNRNIFFLFLLTDLFYFLYDVFPKIPWYGLIYVILILCASISINHLLLNRFKDLGIALLLSFSFFFAFLLKPYAFANYTFLSILLGLSGLLNLIHNQTRQHLKDVFFITIFIIALLIRPPVIILSSFLLLGFVFFSMKTAKENIIYITKIGSLVLGLYLISAGIYLSNQDFHNYKWDIKRSQILDKNIQIDINSIDDPKLKAFSAAYKSWFFADSAYAENFEYIDKMLEYKQTQTFSSTYAGKLKDELSKVFTLYNKSYHKGLNWGVEFIVILFLTLYLMIISKRSKSKFSPLAYLIAFIFYLVVILVYKFEYRFFYPILVLVLLHFTLINSYKKHLKILVSLLLIFLSFYQLLQTTYLVKENKTEYQNINKTLSSLEKELSDKQIIFDQISVSILHNGLLNTKSFNDQWICMKESFNITSKNHKKSLTKKFGGSDFSDIVRKSIDNQDYVFLFSKNRTWIIEYYCNIFYEHKIKFIEHPLSEEIINVNYSIFNFPMDIKLFYLESTI